MGKLSDNVRADFQRLFALGFLEVDGLEIEDDDTILVEDASIIKAIAESFVSDELCDQLAPDYLENPDVIHQWLYEQGGIEARKVEERWVARVEDGASELMDLEG